MKSVHIRMNPSLSHPPKKILDPPMFRMCEIKRKTMSKTECDLSCNNLISKDAHS